jgi:PAS domain S-box-containing protein
METQRATLLELAEMKRELQECKNQLQQERAERERLAAVAQLCSESVLVTDPEGVIVFANPACEVNSGYPLDDFVGKTLEEQHFNKDDPQFQEMMGHLQSGDEWYGNIPNLKQDGSYYLEEVSALPVWNGSGMNRGYVVMKKNVTEHRRLESIASSVNLMDNVGFVFSGIRHELGNPVNSLKMTLSVLSKKIDQFPPETVVEFLERSQHEIGRIEYLLKSLRSFSMFEKPIPGTVLLSVFLKNLLDMHGKDFAVEGIESRVEVADDAEKVFADERVLVQVMLNLLSNAVHALEGRMHPVITIRASRESDTLICLSITDNGCGISEENQEVLFKPFYTTRAEGTGLGLVIVQKMLVEMDCSIRVESKKYEGTTFSISLPTGLE